MFVEDCLSTVETYDDSVSSSLAFEFDTEVASIEVMPMRRIGMYNFILIAHVVVGYDLKCFGFPTQYIMIYDINICI